MDNLEATGQAAEPTDEQIAAELTELSDGEAPDSPDGEQPKAEAKTQDDGTKADEPTIEVDGKKYGPDEVREILKNQMLHADYTRKRQAEAEIIKEYERREQERILEDFYGAKRPRTAAAPTEVPAITDEDLAMMDPAARKAYDAAMKAVEIAASVQGTLQEKQRQEQRVALEGTLDGFVDKLVREHGYSREDAEMKTAEVARTVRTEGFPYTTRSFDMVFNSTRDFDAELERRVTADREKYLKTKDADARATGILPGAAGDTKPKKLDLWALEQKDPDAATRAGAELL